jgi:antitoxin HigA-1
MIVSFTDDATEDLYHGKTTHHVRQLPPVIIRAALRKLDMHNAADRINDLREPPGNRLETLKGDFEGYYSIRINDQWRIIFQWKDTIPTGYR